MKEVGHVHGPERGRRVVLETLSEAMGTEMRVPRFIGLGKWRLLGDGMVLPVRDVWWRDVAFGEVEGGCVCERWVVRGFEAFVERVKGSLERGVRRPDDALVFRGGRLLAARVDGVFGALC